MPSVEEQSELPGAGDMRPIRLRKLEATQRLLGDTIAIDERSEEHTSELQSPNCISYAVFCLKKIFF